MAEPKTRPTKASVAAFFNALPRPEQRKDSRTVASLMRAATGAKATMWGTNIVGFGRQPITGANGRATDWPTAAFAPRSTGLVLYLDPEVLAAHPLRSRLGPHRVGKSCLYIKRLADVDVEILESLVTASVRA